jgi:two-component system, NarL family, capsular synthesis sensor histidine kinase RcsC
MIRMMTAINENHIKAYTIFSDITKTKEEELNLLRAKQKAEEADQLKSAFLATTSHEIRTPLNGIMGHLDLIISNGLEPDYKGENLDGLQVAMDSGKLLLSIIQDILDLSKIEAGLLDIDTTSSLDLRSIISNTMKLAHAYQIQCKKNQIASTATGDNRIQLKLETLFDDVRIANRIHGDEFRLQQVLNNLLSNAIKVREKMYKDVCCCCCVVVVVGHRVEEIL